MFKHLIILSLMLILFAGTISAYGKDVASLARKGNANYVIVSPANASDCEKFAAQELKRFLVEMSKANFEVSDRILRKSIVVSSLGSLPKFVTAGLNA